MTFRGRVLTVIALGLGVAGLHAAVTSLPSQQTETEYAPQVGRMLPVQRLAVSRDAMPPIPAKPACSLSPTAAQWRQINRTAEITGMSAKEVYAFLCVLGIDH